MGVSQIAVDQILGYEEVVCLCKQPNCQRVRARLTTEFHIVKNSNGQLAAEPVQKRIQSL